MDEDLYLRQWRYRIEKMRVFLFNNNGNLIENPNGEYSLKITYPTLFKDINANKEKFLFVARRFYCR